MSPTLYTSTVDDMDAQAQRIVADMIGRRVQWLVSHPTDATNLLARFGLDMLAPPAVITRAKALYDIEEERPHRGAFEFGRMRDLRVAIEYAKQMETMTCL